LPLIGELHLSSVLLFDLGVYMLVVGATVLMLVAIAHQSLRARTAAGRKSGHAGGSPLMEIVFAIAIGVMAGSGIYLLLRPRTFQVIMGLSLLSYAVNLFIFGMGRLVTHRRRRDRRDRGADPALYADPVPQALVLTAIVIGFAVTALFLVVLLAAARAERHRPCRRPGASEPDACACRPANDAHLPMVCRSCCRWLTGALLLLGEGATPAGEVGLFASVRHTGGNWRSRCCCSPPPADATPWPDGVGVYALGNWPRPSASCWWPTGWPR
jgi:multicomponent K+:H+ antiporter subunit C